MFRIGILSVVAAAGLAAPAAAQFPRPFPQQPFPQPFPQQPFPQPFPGPAPGPVMPASAFEGVWYFRGDPFKPCYVQTAITPVGPRLVFTNENGTQATAFESRSGRQVTIPDWNVIGTLRGNALVWPNGDFWSR